MVLSIYLLVKSKIDKLMEQVLFRCKFLNSRLIWLQSTILHASGIFGETSSMNYKKIAKVNPLKNSKQKK